MKKKQRPTEYEKPLKIDASFDDAMKAITQDENEIRVLDFSEKTNEIEVKPIKYGQLIFTTLLPNFLPNGTFLEIKIQSNIIESHPLSLSDFYNPIPDNKEVKLIRNDGIPVKYNIPKNCSKITIRKANNLESVFKIKYYFDYPLENI